MTNKLIIPTILTATILIAGMFAFMPVQQASTVHTTIQAGAYTLQTDTFDASAFALVDGNEIEVTSANDFCLTSLIVEFALLDADDDTGYSALQVDDVALTTALGVAQTAVIIDDAGVATRSVDVMDAINAEAAISEMLCSDGGTIDIILEDAIDATDGDLIAGEITTITATAIVDGDAVITVTLAAAD